MRNRGDWLQTYTGLDFFPFDPQPEEIRIEDIAHALALTTRFGGHCREFYSVAEHAVRASYVCDAEFAFATLNHDDSEAFWGDIPRPIKRHWDMRWLRDRDAELQIMIEKTLSIQRFGGKLPAAVYLADEIMLATEARDLMGNAALERWSSLTHVEPLAEVIVPWTWQEAERRFLDRFAELLQ